MDDTVRPVPLLTRRSTLTAVAAGAVGLALAGCGSDATQTAPTSQAGGPATSGAVPSGAAPTTGSGSPGSAGGAGAALVAAADVPVGGATVVTAEGAGYVVAQPSAGRFVAHSAKCTHMGCTVAVDKALALQCPCHGSRYDAATGEVQRGPATRALAEVDVTVSEGQVRLS